MFNVFVQCTIVNYVVIFSPRPALHYALPIYAHSVYFEKTDVAQHSDLSAAPQFYSVRASPRVAAEVYGIGISENISGAHFPKAQPMGVAVL